MVDLTTLPKPEVIEEISLEAIIARKKAKFQELWEVVRIAHPELPSYDVAMLETDPAIILIEADAYDEMLLRGLANSVARSNLLAFATKGNLDHIAADHGVTRLTGESDEALRERIVLHDQGSSTAGPEEWYEYWARTASVLVQEATAYRAGTGPAVTIAITSTNNGGVPTPGLIAAVQAVVSAPNIRVLSDVVTVVSASSVNVNVKADIWLLPDTPMSVFDGLDEILTAAFDAEARIGFDINTSWLISKLMVPGVAKVKIITPADDVVVPSNIDAHLGTVDIQFKGRQR